jgi:hypothetical protein
VRTRAVAWQAALTLRPTHLVIAGAQTFYGLSLFRTVSRARLASRNLLDTNTVIHVTKRWPIDVMSVFNENAGRMAISAITMSELFHGTEKSAKVTQSLAVVEQFASLFEVLPYSAKASLHRGAAMKRQDAS